MPSGTTPVDTGVDHAPAHAADHAVHYDPDADGAPDVFRGSPRFALFRQHFEDLVSRIAGHAAVLNLDHPLLPVLDTFLFDVFDNAAFDSLRGEMYLLLKPALERIVTALEDPSLPQAQIERALDNLVAPLAKCAGGKINACADAAVRLELARQRCLRGQASLAFYDVLKAELQSAVAEQDAANEMEAFETHQVQAMMNALAPIFGFPPVGDPLAGPLSSQQQREVDRLQSRAGVARTSSLMLATLADRYCDTLTGLLGPTHPLTRGDVATFTDAAQVHALMVRHPDLAAFGEINPVLVLTPHEDDDGDCDGYRLNRDTSLLQWQLAQLLRAEGMLAGVESQLLAAWTEAPLQPAGPPRQMELRQLGGLRWVSDSPHGNVPRAVQLADLAHVTMSSDFPALALLTQADALLRGMDAGARADCTVPKLEEALIRLKADDLHAAMGLDMLWAHIRADAARCAGAQRVLMDKVPMGEATRAHLLDAAKLGLATAAAYWQRSIGRTARWADVLRDGDRHPLVAAAAAGHMDTLRTLVEAGAQLLPVCDTAIARAEQAGHADAAAYLRQMRALQRELFDAIRAGGLDRLDLALATLPPAMSCLGMRDTDGKSLLQVAIDQRSLAGVRRLVEHGADVHQLSLCDDGTERTPLAAAVLSDQADIAQYLIDNGASRGVPPAGTVEDYLPLIVGMAQSDTAARLLDAVLWPMRYDSVRHAAMIRAATMEAILQNRAELVTALIRANRAIVVSHDGGIALLRHAVHLDDARAAAAMVNVLLEQGCSLAQDLRPQGMAGPMWTPVTVLEAAVAKGRGEVVQTLLRAHGHGHAEQAWSAAVRTRNVAMMHLLLQQPVFSADDAKRRRGRLALLFDAALRVGDLRAVSFALAGLEAPAQRLHERIAAALERGASGKEMACLAILDTAVHRGWRLDAPDWDDPRFQWMNAIVSSGNVYAAALELRRTAHP